MSDGWGGLPENSVRFRQTDRREQTTLEYAGVSDVGRVRRHNEDAFAFASVGANVPFAVVCDGMGGHLAGEVASQMAIDVLLEEMNALKKIHLGKLRTVVASANQRIFRHAISHEACKGMGTTLVLAVFDEEDVFVLNVGDSRAYHYDQRGRRIAQISRDHSLLEELISTKQLSGDQIKNFPYRNVITRSLGARQVVKPDVFECRWQSGDCILLCSDGMSDCIQEEEILAVLHRERENMLDVCNELVDMANERGGKDNITVVVVQNAGEGDGR